MTKTWRAASRGFLFLSSAVALLAAQTGSVVEIRDHLRKAAEYLKQENLASAVNEFNAVLVLDPRNAQAYANLGALAFFRHNYVDASRDLKKALDIDPSLVRTQALLGICERRLGQNSAQALLEKSFPLLKDRNVQIQAGLELANIYYQQGNLDRAASTMRSLVDIAPDNVEVLYMAQRVYSDLADETLNKLALLAPGSARMQQVIAERLINEGDLKGATEHFRKALEIDPRLPGAGFELAEALLEAGPNRAESQAESENELKAVVDVEGDSARAECMFARIASRRSDLDAAFAHYSRAFSLNPGNTEAQIGLGRLLTTQGKLQDALKYLRMAVQSDPLNEEAHYRLATVCGKLQLTEESEKEFRLFREIKLARKRLQDLYGKMSRKPPGQEADFPDAEP